MSYLAYLDMEFFIIKALEHEFSGGTGGKRYA